MDSGNVMVKEEHTMYYGEHPDISLPLPGMWRAFLLDDGDDFPPQCLPEQEEKSPQHQMAPAVIPTRQRALSCTFHYPGYLHHDSGYEFPTTELLVQHLPNCGIRNTFGQLQNPVQPPLVPTGQRTVYTCDHPSCINHSNVYGFSARELLVQHQLNCGFRNSTGQIGNLVQPHLVPIGTLYKVVIPIESMAWHQAPNPLSQQMVSGPMVLQSQAPFFEEVHHTFLFNNMDLSGNVAIQYGNQGLGPLD